LFAVVAEKIVKVISANSTVKNKLHTLYNKTHMLAVNKMPRYC